MSASVVSSSPPPPPAASSPGSSLSLLAENASLRAENERLRAGALASSSSSSSSIAASPPPSPPPRCTLLLANSKSRHNIGQILRSAVAFSVSEIIVCGASWEKIKTFGAQRTEAHAQLRRAPSVRAAAAELRAAGVALCGIEICARAAPVMAHPWRGPTAFLAGAEGDGLCAAHAALCDSFVYIPQSGNGTASLNVAIAASLILGEALRQTGAFARLG